MFYKSIIVGTCALTLAVFATTASAYIVDTSAGTYDTEVLTTPPNPQTFDEIEAILTSQIWWGDQNLAIEFATAVGPNLGLTSSGGHSFAFGETVTSVQGCAWVLGPIQCGSQARNVDFNWVVATEVTMVPVPTAVWLFGSGLLGLVGLARRKA